MQEDMSILELLQSAGSLNKYI